MHHLRLAEPRLQPLIERYGPPRLQRKRNSFHALAHSIIYQQLNGKAANTIYRRFLRLFPTRRFPSPEDVHKIPINQLRSAGISRRKATYLHALAEAYIMGDIKPKTFGKMSNAEIKSALTKVKGIGPWTADMFLMFSLNRPDILPVGDLGIQKGMQRLYCLPTLPNANDMRRLTAPWKPYRSVGSWYLWRLVD